MDYKQLNGGTLAFVGDAVMTLQVRKYLTEKGITQLKELQNETIRFVSAKAQAAFSHYIEEEFGEEEKDIFRRGRNFKSHSVAKNQSVIDYRNATGIEALWGYLELSGQKERLDYLCQKLIEFVEENE